jgi:hypothetical protein
VTAVASDIVVRPSVEFKAIESDTLRADLDEFDAWPHLAIEPILVHAEIAGCIA